MLKNIRYKQYFESIDLKYKRYVIWGLRTDQTNTFRHIMRHFYETMLAIGLDPVWVDDNSDNAYLIEPGVFVFAANVAGQFLPVVKGAYYCLHNFDELSDIHSRIDPKFNIRLQVYTNSAIGKKWNEATLFEGSTRTLYQPWGTNLLPDQFRQPTHSMLPIVFWVGTIWSDPRNRGNMEQINEFRKALRRRLIYFKQLKNVSDEANVRAVRLSRIAPAIAGGWQVENNLLPCRMFKNISYGQLGISNVRKFSDILGDTSIYHENTDEIIDTALRLSSHHYKELVRAQQIIVASDHTYVSKISNILRAFEELA